MTHNLTYSSFNKNREYEVIVDDPALVAEVARVFDDDWSRRAPDLENSLLVWSPVNSRERITALIDGAATSLDLEQNSLLDEDLNDQLHAAARAASPCGSSRRRWTTRPTARWCRSNACWRAV